MSNINDVPDDVWNFLKNLDGISRPSTWTISKTRRRLTLTIYLPISDWNSNEFDSAPHPVSRDPSEPPCLPQQQTSAEKSPTETSIDLVPTSSRSSKKKKSPSQRSRDRARWKVWKERQSAAKQSAGKRGTTHSSLISTQLPAQLRQLEDRETERSKEQDPDIKTVDTPQDGLPVPSTDSEPTTVTTPTVSEGSEPCATTPLFPKPQVNTCTDQVLEEPDYLQSRIDDLEAQFQRQLQIQAELLAVCFECHRPESATFPIKACAKCKVVKYCSKNCQTKSWKAGHNLRCAELVCLGTSEQCN